MATRQGAAEKLVGKAHRARLAWAGAHSRRDPMKPITLGLLALFALAVSSSGIALADCAGHVVKAPDQTTIATTKGSTPVTVPTTRDDG